MKNFFSSCALCALAVSILLINSGISHAQSSGAYLVPRQIFIGDLAVLVLPLPPTAQNSADIILTEDQLPKDPDIDFHRIVLERRTTGSRLMIEFSAFVPGTLEFPVIEIEGESFAGLFVTVNSILERQPDRMLSGAASTLAMPGTALMLYGSMAVFVFIILFVIWFIFRGGPVLAYLRERWKFFRLFAGLRKIEKHLNREILKGTDKRIILDILSDETRAFLSALTGINCRAMTAREFENLPRESILLQEGDPSFLKVFFHRCDKLRFSGADITSHNILNLLALLRNFIDMLAMSKKKEKHREEKAA